MHSLKNLIKTHKLIDIWRELNPSKKQFTWQRKNNRNEATRIDFFLISPQLRPLILSSDIRPAVISHTDHQAISLKIKERQKNRGRGYFKINNSILKNNAYQNIITNIINKYNEKSKMSLTRDPMILWDLLKAEIREQTITFCKRNAKTRQDEIYKLENKLQKFNQKLNDSK